MNEKPAGGGHEIMEERFRALLSNTNAARAVSHAVEGTIGPKGLDTMMIDKFGEVVITNDGVTILTLMEANHPAAKMLINAARAQQLEIGDGTTTATIMAGALVTEGASYILKGVPATKVIEGIRVGIDHVIGLTRQHAREVTGLDDPLGLAVALIAGREDREIADLTLRAARLIGEDLLRDDDFRFADSVKAQAGVESEIFPGVTINRDPVNREMPTLIEGAKILVIDDALEPEGVSKEAQRTETGWRRYLELRQLYERNLCKVVEAGINVVLVDRGIDDLAEEVFSEAGVMVIQRVPHRELTRVCEHTGARMIKRAGLNRDATSLAGYLGTAQLVQNSQKWGHTRVCGGGGSPEVTILVGAATEEVVDERERIARDAAAALQAALKGGVVPGGGAFEVWLATQVEKLAHETQGMTSYGIRCVKEALVRPFSCIVANAGFNPLEKLEEVMAAQKAARSSTVGIDCNQGKVIDMLAQGVVDPALVKIYACKAAAEVAQAILRINTIAKKKDAGEDKFDFA